MFFVVLAITAAASFGLFVRSTYRGFVRKEQNCKYKETFLWLVKTGQAKEYPEIAQDLFELREFREVRKGRLFQSFFWKKGLWKRFLLKSLFQYARTVASIAVAIVIAAWSLLASWNMWAVVMQTAYAYIMGGVA